MSTKNKKNLNKIEVFIYFLAFFSILLLSYLFFDRNSTSLVIQERPQSNDVIAFDSKNGGLSSVLDNDDNAQATDADQATDDSNSDVSSDDKATDDSSSDVSSDDKATDDSSSDVSSDDKATDDSSSDVSSDDKATDDSSSDMFSDDKATDDVSGDVSSDDKATDDVSGDVSSDDKATDDSSSDMFSDDSGKDNNKNYVISQKKKGIYPYEEAPKKNYGKRGKKIKKVYLNPKKFNWVVLNRYQAKPKKGLYKVRIYTVAEGDSLWRIARKFRIHAINLVAANPSLADPDQLEAGQSIFITNK